VTLICVDANVVIQAATTPSSDASAFIERARRQQAPLAISPHSYEEIARGSSKDDGAGKRLAERLTLLPYYPKGTISDLLGTIDDLAGTFDDMRRSDEILRQLRDLARAGANLHDKGAITDAIWASCSHFITEDRDLVAAVPRKRIEAAFQIRIVRPRDAML